MHLLDKKQNDDLKTFFNEITKKRRNEDIETLLTNICYKSGIYEQAYCLEVVNNDLSMCGVHKGDIIIFNTSADVTVESLAILNYKNKMCAVWYMGKDWAGYRIICDRFPRALPIRNNIELKGRAIAILRRDCKVEYI